MIEESALGTRRAPETVGESEAEKVELQQRMAEARDSIAQTVAEIKETVGTQYQSVRDSVAETFDWREQFRKHPVEWSIGALAVGLAVGYGLAGALRDTEAFERLHAEIDKIGGRLYKQFAGVGDQLVKQLSGVDQYVVPALLGAALPLLATQLKDLTGVDFSNLLKLKSDADGGAPSGKGKGKKGKKKKNGSKKKAARKGA